MKRFIVVVTLDGTFEHIENNIDMIVSSIDPIGLAHVDIEIQNYGDVEE